MSFERRASQARELRQIMQDELESAVNSLELTTLQRDLLWQEFGLYRYAELNFSPKLPDEPKQHPARTPKKPILSKESLANVEAAKAEAAAELLGELSRYWESVSDLPALRQHDPCGLMPFFGL